METTNKVHIIGTISENFRYSHSVYNEKFYTTIVRMERLSGVCDNIPMIVSERLTDIGTNWKDCQVEAIGQFRSFNKDIGGHRKCLLFIFAIDIHFVDEPNDVNQIYLDGYICKKPIYRETPFGKEITDVMLAINRSCGKSDYIPCICWGRNARYASQFELGDHIVFEGRIQSREYTKKLTETDVETRTAYEISVSKMEVVERKGERNEEH